MLALCFLYDSFSVWFCAFVWNCASTTLMYNNIDIKIACFLHINFINIFFDSSMK